METLGQQGRKYAEDYFSIEQALNKYEQLFTEVAIKSTSTPEAQA